MLLAFSAMEKYRRRNSCRICGASYPYVSISARGLCPDHTRMRAEANNRQLHEHEGPYFEHWRRRCLAAFGGVALDEVRESQ